MAVLNAAFRKQKREAKRAAEEASRVVLEGEETHASEISENIVNVDASTLNISADADFGDMSNQRPIGNPIENMLDR